jgi:hypothetical protein
MVGVPVVVAANKSDIVTAEDYLTMSMQTGEGVDKVLAEILTHKPAPEERKRASDILSPLPQDPEEIVSDEEGGMGLDGRPVRKPRPKRARKPRTVVESP